MKVLSFIGLVTVAGAAVAGYAYYRNYKKVHEDLESDFNEFEDEHGSSAGDRSGGSGQGHGGYEDPNRKYTALNASKGEFVDAARNTLEAAKGMIPPAKNIARDMADIIQEKACDANVVAGDYYNAAKDKAREVAGEARDKAAEVAGETMDKAREVAGEAVDKAREVASQAKDRAKVVAAEAKSIADGARDKLGIGSGDDLCDKTQDDIVRDIDVAGNIREEE